jgi:hypothetical protein
LHDNISISSFEQKTDADGVAKFLLRMFLEEGFVGEDAGVGASPPLPAASPPVVRMFGLNCYYWWYGACGDQSSFVIRVESGRQHHVHLNLNSFSLCVMKHETQKTAPRLSFSPPPSSAPFF